MHALDGVRVLEVAQMVAAPYAAKLLGDLGADVIKIEPPTGDAARRYGPFPPGTTADPEQSGLFLGLNTNKRSVCVDLDSGAGRERLADLVAQADIVIHDLDANAARDLGLGPESLDQRRELVVCAVTPFGHAGPHASWTGEELTIVHGGGWGWLIPGDDPDPTAPPLTVFGHPASCQAGLAAAMTSLAAHHKARSTGIGDHIDLSAMAHVSGMLETALIAWTYRRDLASRNGGRILTPWNIFECSDGRIFLVTVEQDQWERLVDMMGTPDWATLDVFATIERRAENQDLLNHYLREWTSQHTVQELFHEGQRRRICFAPVFTMADLAEQEHLHARGFFHQASHPVAGELTYMGAPFMATPSPWELRTTAPALGADERAEFRPRDDSSTTIDESQRHARPLEGVRVVDFSWVWAGPYATMHLSFLGAEVIKVESPKRPSLGRRLPVHAPDVPETLNTCAYFNQWDQGKKSVELDLTDPQSVETVLALIATADVVVDNYATGVMDRLGLGDEVLRDVNPNVVIASITGYGHTGPLCNYMGYGPTTAPLSGLTALTGHPGGRPEEAGISFGDPAAGLTAAFAVTAALFGRTDESEPTRIDVSLWEATAANTVDAWMRHALGAAALSPMGSRHPNAAPHGVFRCAGEDRWVSIACMNDEQWMSLVDEMAASELAHDPRFATSSSRKANEVVLEERVSSWTSDQDPWTVTERLQQRGIAAYPSMDPSDIEKSPHLEARGFFERFDHPEVGQRTHSGIPWRSVNAPNGVVSRAPLLGEHTAEILGALGR